MGLVKYMAKEFFKEIDDKSREFFEFVLPPIDLHQEGDNFIVTVDIPGFNKNDIKVTMNGNVLSIKAEKKEETKEVNLNNKDKIGRNDPCYCGSGLKYKKCGMLDKCTKNS